jgi:hypothetical protein
VLPIGSLILVSDLTDTTNPEGASYTGMDVDNVARMTTSCANWLLSDIRLPKEVQRKPEPEHAWWRVMCLTGVGYFSLAYPVVSATHNILWLITSAAVAVTLHVWQRKVLRYSFGLIAIIFSYTTVLNIYERPEGLKISSFFILAIILSSLLSRALRSTELRILKVELSSEAVELRAEDEDQLIRVIAHTPRRTTEEFAARELYAIDIFVRNRYGLTSDECLFFLEVERTDASEFEHTLCVEGRTLGKNQVLFAKSSVVANSIAAVLIQLEKHTGRLPHAYFKWKEGNPVANIMRFVFFGEGDTAPHAHEVLRRAIADPRHRPVIHVS